MKLGDVPAPYCTARGNLPGSRSVRGPADSMFCGCLKSHCAATRPPTYHSCLWRNMCCIPSRQRWDGRLVPVAGHLVVDVTVVQGPGGTLDAAKQRAGTRVQSQCKDCQTYAEGSNCPHDYLLSSGWSVALLARICACIIAQKRYRMRKGSVKTERNDGLRDETPRSSVCSLLKQPPTASPSFLFPLSTSRCH